MTHDELVAYLNKEIDQAAWTTEYYPFKSLQALRAVVKLHNPSASVATGTLYCDFCEYYRYPCLTIQAIEEELE